MEIASRLKIDRKTVAKYMREEDFKEKAQEKRAPASKLDPWKSIIDGWLEEDQRMRFKQRHAAQHVHHRLRTEYPEDYRCSYPLVRRYVKQRKSERGADRGYLELVWPPGIQALADAYVGGRTGEGGGRARGLKEKAGREPLALHGTVTSKEESGWKKLDFLIRLSNYTQYLE